MNKQQLITELQTKGLQLIDRPNGQSSEQMGANGRKGGAGPSDH